MDSPSDCVDVGGVVASQHYAPLPTRKKCIIFARYFSLLLLAQWLVPLRIVQVALPVTTQVLPTDNSLGVC
jgi:hypothetical protein